MNDVCAVFLAVIAVLTVVIYLVTATIENRRQRISEEEWAEFCRENNRRAMQGKAPLIYMDRFRA